MPRIIVTTHPQALAAGEAPVLLDEYVSSVHLASGHAALQLIERLGWAISDAEDAEDLPAQDRPEGGQAREQHVAAYAWDGRVAAYAREQSPARAEQRRGRHPTRARRLERA